MGDVAQRRRAPAEILLIVALGVAIGVSALANGLYDVSGWGVAGLAASALLLAATLARTAVIDRRVVLTAGALGGLGLVSLLSSHWAADDSATLLDGTRWLVYATALLALGALVLGADGRRALFVALLAGCAISAGYVELRLLVGTGDGLFTGGRLLEPVGYANGEAALLLMGFWLAAALAERTSRSWLGAGAVAAAALQLGLTVLTQTRASIPAIALSVVLVMALAPGRVRRGWLLLVCAIGPLIAAKSALDVYDAPHAVAPPDALTEHAGRLILLGALVAGAVWFAVETVRGRVSAGTHGPRASRAAGIVLVAFAVLGAGATIAVTGSPFTRISHGWDQFRSLRPPPADQSRFASIGGNRYDYWRIAVDDFKDHTFKGVGAGNYVQTYPQRRKTSEYVKQPHSLELQVLSELGIVGAIPLLVLMVALGWAILAGLRPPTLEHTAAGLGGAAVLLVWLVQTSVDWLHLLPGVTAVALAAVILTAPHPGRRLRVVGNPTTEALRVGTRRALGYALPIGFAVLAVLTGLLATRVTLADRYRSKARDALRAGDVTTATRDVARSLRFDGNSADTYYVRSAALARKNDYAGARAALFVVVARQPDNFLPWVLLGDLASLRGDRAAAITDYTRARELNPQDPAMAANVARAQKLQRS